MTNPERLWVVCGTTTHGSFFAMARTCVLEAREEAALFADSVGSMLPVAEYVLASVAAAAVANAPGYETAMAEANRASGLEDEAAALRAEVEALRSLAKRAADLLRPSFRLTVDGRDTPPNALVADIDAALAKGVG